MNNRQKIKGYNEKNILVIGGSYFAGRVFSIYVSRGGLFTLHVVNRGKYTLNLPGVHEYKCDRHEPEKMKGILPDIKFDAVVDFCGYAPGEISAITGVLAEKIGHYIFISTSSVYDTADEKKEGAPLLEPQNTDPVLEYISNKVMLERELKTECESRSIPYTIVRPGFIYGPFNYAPRESYFIQHIVKGIPVPFPADANKKFSMLYVTDLARALEVFINNKKSHNEEFNLAGIEQVTYASLFSELERCNGAPFEKKSVTIAQVISENIPLPFPLDTDDLCSGKKMTEYFDFTYTSFSEGMDKAFAAFKGVFS